MDLFQHGHYDNGKHTKLCYNYAGHFVQLFYNCIEDVVLHLDTRDCDAL